MSGHSGGELQMSEADYCDCDYSDAEPMEFTSVRHPKARKQHTCEECSGPIFKGETYKRMAGKCDGEFMTFAECSLCGELREWAEISMPCFCAWEIGTLHERVQAMVKDVAPKTPGFFMEYGRRMVKIRQRRANA